MYRDYLKQRQGTGATEREWRQDLCADTAIKLMKDRIRVSIRRNGDKEAKKEEEGWSTIIPS